MVSKKILIGIGGAALVAIVVIILAVTLTKKPECKTEACKNTAMLLKETMDESVDPCDDFFSFACGKFVKRYPLSAGATGPFYNAIIKLNDDLKKIMASEPVSGRKGSAVDKALHLFRGCRNAALYSTNENRKFLTSILKDNLNGCQFVPASMDKGAFNWFEAIAKVIRNIDQNFIFSVLVLPDLKDTSKPAISLYPETPEVIKGVESIIRIPPEPKPIIGYSTPNEQLRQIICQIDTNCNFNSYLDNDISTMLRYYNPDNRPSGSEPNGTMETMTIEQLQNRLPKVKWLDFFGIVFNGTSTQVTKDTPVTTSIGYLQYMIDMVVTGKPQRAIQLFMGYKVIEKFGPILLDSVRYLITGQSVEDKCLQLTNSALGFAVGNLYDSKYVTKETYNETMRLVLELKGAFKELLKENTWMDESTKNSAFLKIDNMVESVSAPDWAKDMNRLDKYYEKMGTISETDFQNSFKEALGFGMIKNADLLKQPLDRKNAWPVKTSAQTNAFYYQNANSMMFPSGILTLPFFVHGRPSSMNYGSFGYVAGHEITHGFDNAGRTRDEWGRTKDWWSATSLRKFVDKSNCFIRQYGSIFVRPVGMYLNGQLTLGENIADNGGIREAFRAHKNYQKSSGEKDERLPGMNKYDQDQLFFISAGYMYCTAISASALHEQITADNHSPNQYRVTVPFQNSEDFSKAFSCGKKDTMNPRSKCVIW